jgi:hypothetical protein
LGAEMTKFDGIWEAIARIAGIAKIAGIEKAKPYRS